MYFLPFHFACSPFQEFLISRSLVVPNPANMMPGATATATAGDRPGPAADNAHAEAVGGATADTTPSPHVAPALPAAGEEAGGGAPAWELALPAGEEGLTNVDNVCCTHHTCSWH